MFLPLALSAFQRPTNTPPQNTKNQGTVTLNCRMYNAPNNADSITLYEPGGLGARPLYRAGRRASDSLYVFTVPASAPRVYLLGQNDMQVARVILGEEKEVNFFANILIMNKGRAYGSAINKSYEGMLKRVESFNSLAENARSEYRRATTAPARSAAIETLKSLEKRKTQYLDSLKSVNTLLWRIGTLYVTPDYYGQKGYNSESDFYKAQYFAYANLAKDREYDLIPDVTTAYENYLKMQLQLGNSPDQISQIADEALAKLPSPSRAHRQALAGFINVAKGAGLQQYPAWAKVYIDTYKTEDFGEVSRLDFEVKKTATFTPGFEAPDLAGMTPDSSTYALSKMRGKVVLVDFWASWCGPCRKENPNVKANYEKYKSKGFDILGVSLDRDAAAWKNAIQSDGLVWHHISDLKGWQSTHAALYSVTSIPQTVLVDKNGRIIARNIRGEALGQKLAEIFGE
jgi:thiol-disulfide isomerase/thioredoxin